MLFIVLAIGIASPVLASETRVLTPEIVLDLISADDVRLSPDGNEVVYRLGRHRRDDEPRGGRVRELWIVPAAGGSSSRLEGTGWDAHAPAWSPDGKALAWIAKRDPESPAQVFVMTYPGGKARPLTSSPGGVEDLSWSPDSSSVAFTAWDAKTPEEHRDEREGRDWVVVGARHRQLRIYSADAATGASTLVTQAELTVHDFDYSPDGRRLVIAATETPLEDEHQLRVRPFVVDASGGEPRLLAETVGRLTHPRWSPDGKWIAWLGSTVLTDPYGGSVFRVSADGGAPENLTIDYEGSAMSLEWLPGRPSTLVYGAYERQATVLRRLEMEGSASEPIAPQVVLSGDPSFSRDGRRFAAAASAPSHPSEVFVADWADEPELRRITDSNAALRGLELGAQEVVRWTSTDGLPIEGVLVKPVGYREGIRCPTVLQVHGGSESVVPNGWLASYSTWGQLLAAKGYATLYPNYRGSIGRGVEFARGNRRDLLGREWEDTVTGLDHLIERGIADPDRAGIGGFSWGGYAAGWGATFGSERFQVAVAGAGIYNWISLAGTNETRWHEQLVHWDAVLYDHFLLYLERSPLYEIRKAGTPILLLHGEEDQSVPVSQAIEFETALKWKGVPVELVIYPREGHGMAERPHQKDFLERALGWFDRYLGPQAVTQP